MSKEFTDTQGRSILLACAQLVGGMAVLAEYLDVPEEQLAAWLAGRASPPPEIVVNAGDAVIALNKKGPWNREVKQERVFGLKRHAFKREVIAHAPDDSGVYGLFEGDELIYLGIARSLASIRECLLMHQGGAHGGCTMKAATYTWEITSLPEVREREILQAFFEQRGHKPRCQPAA